MEHEAARAPAEAVEAPAGGPEVGPAVPLLAALDPAARVGPLGRAAALHGVRGAGNRALARAVLARQAVMTPTGMITPTTARTSTGATTPRCTTARSRSSAG